MTDVQALLESFKQLSYTLGQLQTALRKDAALPAWLADHPQSPNPRSQAFELIQQLEYLPGQPAKETLIAPGLIAASTQTLEALQALNLAKQSFKTTLLALKERPHQLDDPWLQAQFEHALPPSPNTVRQTLRKTGLARLHLKQCYRNIPLLAQRPQKVSWTWAHTRAITQITRAKALELLQKREQDEGIQQQIVRCSALPASERLAIIQELAPHLRANLVFEDPATGKRRSMIKASLPIFFPHVPGLALPQFYPPSEKCAKNPTRPRRADVKIDPSPFLPALRAHRYLEDA